jgi:hypothetical protein
MRISSDTERARGIVLRESQVVEMLREDEFASDASIARRVGCGHQLVRRVRESISRDSDGLIAPVYVRPDLPKSKREVANLKRRDIDELVLEVSALMDRVDALEAENAVLGARVEELQLLAA